MKLKISLVLVLMVYGTTYASPIDDAMKECISSNLTTYGMTDCTYEALENWDKELNRVYRELRSVLDADGRASLLSAQRAWIEYKELEIDNIHQIYSSLEGSVYIPMKAHAELQLTKNRTLELQSHLSKFANN